MPLSGVYGAADDAESIHLIHHALDLGISLLDTADVYGWGHNEQLLGRALQGRRSSAIVATKFGHIRGADRKLGVCARPEYVAQACEASLKRLAIDVIDLYYLHRVDPAVPIEDTVGAMRRLVEQGKVRAIGLSEAHPQTIRRAHQVHPIAAVQNEYSLLYREVAEETLVATRELGITLVAYAPLGRSLLTGSIKGATDLPAGDRRLAHPRFQSESLSHNVDLVKSLEAIALEKGCTLAQLVLAWLLAQGTDVVPIPGTKTMARLDQNAGALKVELSPSDIERISAAAPPGAGAGQRYPPDAMERVYA